MPSPSWPPPTTRSAATDGSVHKLYQAFATRPDLLVLADRFYRELLHNSRRSLEDWMQELVATYVAILCGCRYAKDNHGANLVSLLGDRKQERAMLAILEAGEIPADANARTSLNFHGAELG